MAENGESDFDKMVDSIQAELDADAEATYSKKVLAEYKNPQNFGRMNEPDSVAIITGTCGDTMEFFLRINDGKINEVQFMTDGCGATIACGSMTTKLAKGKSLQEVSKFTNNDLIKALDGLPDENLHCAKLAVDTLHKAINNYITDQEK
ncbi:iron-sulfur cluster assembly scaffold protein [[Eubacterium] cellulosolvens]